MRSGDSCRVKLSAMSSEYYDGIYKTIPKAQCKFIKNYQTIAIGGGPFDKDDEDCCYINIVKYLPNPIRVY